MKPTYLKETLATPPAKHEAYTAEDLSRLTALHAVEGDVAAALLEGRPAQLLQYQDSGAMKYELHFTDKAGIPQVCSLYVDEYYALSKTFCARPLKWGTHELLPVQAGSPPECFFKLDDELLHAKDTVLPLIIETHSRQTYFCTFKTRELRNAVYENLRTLLCMNSPDAPLTVATIFTVIEDFGGKIAVAN